MTFKLNDKNYKAVPRLNNKEGCTCEGCAGSFSDAVCLKISDYVAEKPIQSCVIHKVIYKEIK